MAPPHHQRVLVCCDRFKGSLEASKVNAAIAGALHRHAPGVDVQCVSLTDGGAGFLDAIRGLLASEAHQDHGSAACEEVVVENKVVGPLGVVLPRCGYLLHRGTAYIEMAGASGIELVPPAQRNPLETTTYGVGQLLLDALSRGCTAMVIGLGGSATNDGGLGALQACGARVTLRDGSVLDAAKGQFGRGGILSQVESLDLSAARAALQHCRIQLMTDVSNLLTGPEGCSAIYGPQKGATPDMVALLDVNLVHYGRVLKRDAKDDAPLVTPGCGAAGGLGAGLIAACPHATVVRGAAVFAAMARLGEKVKEADVVITGEGRFDEQTVDYGKTASLVINLVTQRNTTSAKPCRTVVICGCTTLTTTTGVDMILPLVPRFDVTAALSHTADCLETVVHEHVEEMLALHDV